VRAARVVGLVVALAVLPARAQAVCAPSARGIFPASGLVGTSVSAVVPGESLAGATVTVVGEPGLTAAVQSSNALQATIRLDLDAAALPGERILVLETAGGSTGVSFTVNPAGGPVLAAVTPTLLATQGVPLAATVTGSGLGAIDLTGITVSGTGLTVTEATPAPDGLSLALGFAVDAAADVGTHAVTIATPLGGAVLQVYVQRPPPQVSDVSPGAGEVGAVVPLTLTGTHLTGAALVITGGTDVTITDVATPDDTTLTATLTIAPGATLSTTEPRLLIVTTESGQTTTEFFVVAAGVPTITGISPGAGEPNTIVPVTLRGLHLTGAAVTDGSADLTLQNVTVVDDETITLDVVVAPGAATNVNATLTATVGLASSNATFRVIPAGTPFIGAVRPPFANRGTTVTVFVDGVNLDTLVPGTGIDISGPKIVESNAAAVDAHTARATLDVDPTANVGFRDVTVTTTGGSFTRSPGFRVNVPGQVPTISGVTPSLVDPGTTTPITVSGSNFARGAVLVTGPGVTIDGVVVTATVITFDLTLAPDAPAEDRAVVVVTENGIARCGIASDAEAPPLVPAQLVKTGALFTVSATGFRLFVLELSLGSDFAPGPRTISIADADGTIVLSRLDATNVERAFRAAHRGWVRLRAVTPTNRFAVTAPVPIRR
jgi:hypothetical protein